MSGDLPNDSRQGDLTGDGFDTWIPLVWVVALWVPAMIAASYAWENGEYYDYGWFVPPAAGFLIWRRWQGIRDVKRIPGGKGMWLAVMLLIPWLLVMRVLGNADPGWRMPMGLLGLTAAVGGHWLIARACGLAESARFGWITLLLLSAVPWPSVVETRIVREMTQAVVLAVAELYQIFGKPVEVIGDRLRLHDITVEVTDGCSGVRSFQSFIMATWFFTELMHLQISRALILLGCGCGAAFLVNMARTYGLAHIRFFHGEEAFHKAHDGMGIAAFVVSAIFFYVLSGKLAESKRTVVRTVKTA